MCLAGVPDCDQNILRLSFSEGYTTWAGSANNGSENTIYAFNDDLTWVKGRHTFKIGGMYQRNHYNGFGRQCIAGCATFTSKETGFAGDPNFTTGGGNPFASFLLGWVDNGSVDTIRFIGQQWPYFAGYFQDDWRVSNKLTLNLGHPVGNDTAPGRTGRPLDGLLSHAAEPGSEQHPRRGYFRGHGPRQGRQPLHSPIPGSAVGDRTSVWPTV